jgi:hypothetical protein
MQVLFLRLKVYNSQYTDGHMTLTEYHKKNMEVMKRIVYSQGAMVSPTVTVPPFSSSNRSEYASKPFAFCHH